MKRELRSHSEPCEHGEPVAFEWNGFWHCRHDGCPGGKLVVIEVLTDECWTSQPLGGHIVMVDDDVRAIVDTVGLAPVPVWVEVTP